MRILEILIKIIEVIGIRPIKIKRIVLFVVLCIAIVIALIELIIDKPPFIKEITIERGVTTQITDWVEMELNGITTIGIQGWSNLKQYTNPEEVLERIYTETGMPDARRRAESDIKNMDQEQWGEFVKGLSPEKAIIVTDTKFAYFTIYLKHKPIDYCQNRIYCKGNTIRIPENLSLVTVRITHVLDVQGYGEKDCVTVKIIKERPRWLWLLYSFMDRVF